MTIEQGGRRRLLRIAAALRLAPVVGWASLVPPAALAAEATRVRVRPGEAGWPDEARWRAAWPRGRRRLLVKVRSPFADCLADADRAACAELFKSARNPYFLGDDAGLTQTFGWVDAWTSRAQRLRRGRAQRGDVAAAVNFARAASPAPRRQGRRPQLPGHLQRARFAAGLDPADERHRRCMTPSCAQAATARRRQRAVSVGAGALWAHAYDAVTTQAAAMCRAAAA